MNFNLIKPSWRISGSFINIVVYCLVCIVISGCDSCQLNKSIPRQFKTYPNIADRVPMPQHIPDLMVSLEKVKESPNSWKAHYWLGLSYFHSKNYHKAILTFQEAIRVKPDKIGPHFYLGYSYMGLGQFPEAISAMQPILSLSNLKPHWRSDVYKEIGNCYWDMGKIDEAAIAYKLSLQFNPHQGFSSLSLGTYVADHKQYDQAKSYFEAACRDLWDPIGLSSSHVYLGRIAEIQIDRKKALQEYNKAIALNKNNQEAHDRLRHLQEHK